MISWISPSLIISGALFMVLASLGLLIMPDLFSRMQAATKSSTCGIGFIMLGVALKLGTVHSIISGLTVVMFVFLTAPVAAHMIARTAFDKDQQTKELS